MHLRALTHLLKKAGADIDQTTGICLMLRNSVASMEEMIFFLKEPRDLSQIIEKAVAIHNRDVNSR